MAVDSLIMPSKEARHLFGRMVARSDDSLCLSIEESFLLGVALQREGKDALAQREVTELINAGWIEESPDGEAWAMKGLVL